MRLPTIVCNRCGEKLSRTPEPGETEEEMTRHIQARARALGWQGDLDEGSCDVCPPCNKGGLDW